MPENPTPAALSTRRSRVRTPLAALASITLALGTLLVPAAAQAASPTAGMTLQKSSTATAPVAPGETFNWQIQVGCSVLTEDCINAQLVDVVPPEFLVGDASTITVTPSSTAFTPHVTAAPSGYVPSGPGQTVTVDFRDTLATPVGEHGLRGGAVTVTIPVTVRGDLPYEVAPRVVTNTAQGNSDNTNDAFESADVTITIPLHVATTATKSFSPDSVLGVVGSPTTVTVGGANTSNSPVDVFTIQDPAAPVGDSGIFASTLRVDSLGTVAWPASATSAVVSAWDAVTADWVSAPAVAAGGTLALPGGVTAASIRGVRIAFTSPTPAMATGETASFQLGTTVRAQDSGARANTSSSYVSVAGTEATATATRSLTLVGASSAVEAEKTITPDRLAAVPYGTSDLTEATVTLTGRNGGTVPLTALSIAEPADPADLSASNPLAPAHPGGGLTFRQFGAVDWPTGATSAAITYFYADGTSTTDTTSAVDTLPVPDAALRVTGFEVTFTGPSLAQNAEAVVPFTVTTNPAQTESRIDVLNQIVVKGVDALDQRPQAFASDTAIVFGDRLGITTDKALTRGTLLAIPGQQTTATLTTRVAPYPESTRAASQIIQYDPPASETGLTDWYRYFDPTALTVTSVPGGATLTVQYRDAGGSWTDVPGMVGITEPGSPHTIAIPSEIRDAIYGLRLVWDSPSGFVPGSTLSSSLDYQLRSTLRGTSDSLPNADLDDVLVNCSSATGRIGGAGPADTTADSPTPCPHVDLERVDPGTGGVSIAKQFRVMSGDTVTGTEKDLTTTRSSERTGVRLGWSTGGRTGVTSMTVTDAAAVPGAFTRGMYDAFNLSRIGGITNTLDPYFAYDQVAIEVYSRSANEDAGGWVTPAGISCTQTSPCTTFAGYSLTTAQQADVVGVRFIFTERPGRTSIAQPAGAGVAVSTGYSRGIDLVYEVRDALRSDADFPVVDGPAYNEDLNAGHSVIRNDARAAAVVSTGTITVPVADEIELRDQNLALDVTKTWTGGPLPIIGTPAPTSRATLRTTNQTPASTISELTIVEPNPDDPNYQPFEQFDLARIYALTHPAGATGVTIDVLRGDGTVLLSSSGTATAGMNSARTVALAWTASQLADAEGVRITYTGRMAVNAFAQVQLDLALRAVKRGSTAPVVAATIDNGVKGTVSDLRFDPASDPANPEFIRASLADQAATSIQVVTANLAVVAGKTFSPDHQVETVRDPITMTLTGRPTGSERVAQLSLTDDRATFWNAFDLVGKGAITLPTFTSPGGAALLQVEACTGGTFTAGAIASTPDAGCVARGGSWQGAGTWLTQAQLDGGAFLPAAVSAGDVTGVRLTVARSDGAQWENPQAPTITINLSVQRRENLRSGGAVPSDYSGNSAAPGETVVGRTTNGVTATVTGIWGSTNSNSTTADYLFERQSTSVQVQKLPTGLRTPGAPIPYLLTVLNTGQRPLENPVITDRLPSDATGAMLVFDPDADTSYTLAVTGGSVPAGSQPVPSGTFSGSGSSLTIDVTTDAIGPTEIRFSFPPGTVIGVGQRVTISVPLLFRPGLTANTAVTNTFQVAGDRVLDDCTAPAGSTATTTSAGKGCTTGTTVTLDRTPALRAYISDRAEATPGIDFPGHADADSQFVGADAEVCRAAQDAEGFSRPPCAPSTIPGQDSTWRLTVQNTGTTAVERLVVATRLPTEGDQTIVTNLTRNSQWAAAFTGELNAQFGTDAVVTTYYTTANAICAAVLQAPTNPAACATNPTTGWALLPAGGLDDPSIVTGLQFVVDFAPTHLFQPADIVTVDIGTTTVAQLRVMEGAAGADPLAVNSLSVAGISQPSAAGITRISALDYSRALLSLATGSVTLTKAIAGPAAGLVPGWEGNPGSTTFTGQLVCTTLGETLTRDFAFTASGGTISPASIRFDNLPGGASCTATETPTSGQTGYTATTVTVDPLADPAALPSIALVNDYRFTQLEIRKTVTIDPAGTAPTGFGFTASCTFLGQPVALAAADAAFTLDDGGAKVITGIPVNATCVVSETDARGAGLTVVEGTTVAPGTVTEDQSARRITFTGLAAQPAAPAASVNVAAFDNRYNAPGVVFVEKAFEGGGAEQFGWDADPAKTFTISVLCTFGGETQYSGDVELNAANGWAEAIPANLVEGSVCRFTEPDLGGADAVTFSPADAGPPAPTTPTGIIDVPGDDLPVTVTATNWYLTGAVEVTKVWTGDAGAVDKFGTLPDLEYEFTLECVRDGADVILPGGGTRVVTVDAPTAEFTGIASGADCVLSETESNGAYSWRVVDAAGDPVDDGEFSVSLDPSILSVADQQLPELSVENEFRFAEVSATKLVAGIIPGDGTPVAFQVELVCTLDGRPIDAAEDAERTIREGETVVWTELAAGADCVVTETDRGGAVSTAYRIGGATGEAGALTTGDVAVLAPLRPTGADDAPNTVTFSNSYPLPNTGAGDWMVSTLIGMSLVFLGLAAGAFALVRRRRLA